MKKIKCTSLLLLVVFVTQAQVPIQIEYLSVPVNEIENHETYQNVDMKAYHRKLLEEKKIYAWYHYRSRFPIGTESEYNYIVVTVASNEKALEARNLEVTYSEKVSIREVYNPNVEVRSPDYGIIQTPYITVDFLNAKLDDYEKYILSMKDNVKPLLDQRVKDKVVVNYSIFDLKESSFEAAYNHVLVTRLPSIEAAKVEAPIVSGDLNERVKSVLWELQEIVF